MSTLFLWIQEGLEVKGTITTAFFPVAAEASGKQLRCLSFFNFLFLLVFSDHVFLGSRKMLPEKPKCWLFFSICGNTVFQTFFPHMFCYLGENMGFCSFSWFSQLFCFLGTFSWHGFACFFPPRVLLSWENNYAVESHDPLNLMTGREDRSG